VSLQQTCPRVIPEGIRVAHIAAQGVDGLVAAYVHHLEERCATRGRGGQETLAEASPRKRVGIEPQSRRTGLHDEGDTASRGTEAGMDFRRPVGYAGPSTLETYKWRAAR
jgi:hypothetical protein